MGNGDGGDVHDSYRYREDSTLVPIILTRLAQKERHKYLVRIEGRLSAWCREEDRIRYDRKTSGPYNYDRDWRK